MSSVKPSRRDSEYWQRLRRDKASNFAAGAVVFAVIFALLAWIGLLVPGSQMQARANPLYWAILLPFGYWGGTLGRFTPWAVKLMCVMFLAAPIAAGAALLFIMLQTPDQTDYGIFFFAASSLASATGFFLYRGSLLQREGPFPE